MGNRYADIIREVFLRKYRKNAACVAFHRDDCVQAAEKLGFDRIKNLGDIVYSFRFRTELPEEITKTAPKGCEWVIVGSGVGQYEFRLGKACKISLTTNREQIKILDATPEIVGKYMPGRDEQALLTRVRYNRVVDIFTGLTCYSIQNHFRTTVDGIGQIEVDEIYIGISRSGAHYVLPCQAKSPNDKFGIVQVMQDIALCRERYPNALCRPIAMQFLGDGVFGLLELKVNEGKYLELVVVDEKHYHLVKKGALTNDELKTYAHREK